MKVGVSGLLVPPGDAGALRTGSLPIASRLSLRVELGVRNAEIVRRKFQSHVFSPNSKRFLGNVPQHLVKRE